MIFSIGGRSFVSAYGRPALFLKSNKDYGF